MAKIIIADDESITIIYLQDLLSSLGHQVVGITHSGPEAHKLSVDLVPDLVIMDINMPGEYDGLEAGNRIVRELGIPIIFITAYSSKLYIEQIAKYGAYGYIQKPFEAAQIETSIYIALFRNKMEHQMKRIILKYKSELESQIIIQYILKKINHTVDPYDSIKELIQFISSSIKIDGIAVYYLDKRKGDRLFLNKFHDVVFNKNMLPDEIDITDFNKNQLENMQKINMFKSFNLFPAEVKNYSQKSGLKSLLIIPLIIEESFYGIIAFLYFKKKSFGLENRNFFKIITETISIAFKRHYDLIRINEMEQEKLLQEKMILQAEQFVSFGQLTSAIAHEIRQPLQSIKVLTDSVLFWEKEDKKLSYEDILGNFTKISARVDRIERIIKNMNLMIKSPEKIEIKPVNINYEIEEIASQYKQKLSSHNIVLELELNANIKEIFLSEIQIQQVIVNLLNNAINALDSINIEDKKIKIKTADFDIYILLMIYDNGPGIDDKNKNKIFNPFFSTANKTENMGLGLYIVQNILKCYNSTIEISDNDGGGAIFTIKFFKRSNLLTN